MASPPIVETFDEREGGIARFGLCLEPAAMRSSHSSVAKKLSHMALSYASPTEPIEGRTPASRQRWPNSIEVYCEPCRSDGSCPGLPRHQCHVQSVNTSSWRAWYPSTSRRCGDVRIEHDSEIEKARPCRNIGDIGDPQPIRRSP